MCCKFFNKETLDEIPYSCSHAQRVIKEQVHKIRKNPSQLTPAQTTLLCDHTRRREH